MAVDLADARGDLVRGIASDALMADWARHYGVELLLDIGLAHIRESDLREFVGKIARLDPGLGAMDIHALVADAAALLSAGSGDHQRDQRDDDG